MNSVTAFGAAAFLVSSAFAKAQIDQTPRSRPAYRINWENIQEEMAFDGKYEPKDGRGYTKAIYYMKLDDGTTSKNVGLVLYLRPEHDGKRSPKGSIIAAYRYDDDGVRLVNQYRFKFTSKTVTDDPWVFALVGVGKTGARLY